MGVYTYRFDEVALKDTKRWTDATGKKRTRTRKFYQTINPFNKNTDGTMKTRAEIEAELRVERDAWLAAPETEAP